ncbi:MAG: hypothetical protein JXA28_03265, partial [Bacteroidetes bacterium]|nr:hypothetical protein [Bacteroidota bacterium]
MSRKKDSRRPAPRKETPPPVAVFGFSETYRRLLTALFPLIAVVSGLYYTLPMEALIEETGLPLDAAYIPLVFARSLLEYGAYSFHATDMITSGALAPLQVLLLAGIALFTSDGITASFILGIASFAVMAGLTFRLGLLLFPDRQWLAACAALVIALAPRFGSAAVAGVPTMLFSALILASATAYFARRSVLFFLFAGLALWVKPDALLFLLAAIVHLLYNHLAVPARNKPDSVPGTAVTGRQTGIGALLFLLLAAGYAVFNAALGTGVFPLPFLSELAYYSGSIGAFLSEVLRFFTFSWSGVLLLFTLLAVVYLVVDLVRRRPLPILMSAAVL